MDALNDAAIIDAWHDNARPWTAAVREGHIESRKRITDQAIVDAVLACAPRRVLDIGCGEGWLMRALAQHDIDVIGVDAIPELVEAARQAGSGDFRLLSYEQIAGGALPGPVDALVCNFSLLGEDSVDGIFRVAAGMLGPRGRLIVQTLHPVAACGELPYRDGWRQGSWDGCGDGFAEPAPWYFRTMESWISLFADHGLPLTEMREPLHPDTGMPASLILIGEAAR